MDNSLEYAKMIEIPVKTCEYSFKRKPLFLRKKKLINAVNRQLQEDKSALISGENNEEMNNAQEEVFKSDNNSCDTLPAIYDEKLAMREKRKNTIISAQVVAIFALISAIILTNVFWENSAMNTLFRSVFYSDIHDANDERDYNDFTLTLPIASEDGVSIVDGAISVKGEYSLYPVCDGVVSKVERASDGTYTLTLKHSESFLSVIEGLDLVYFTVGEEINRHLPVGFVKNIAKVYLYNGENLLTNYAAIENSIIFNE